MQATGVFVCECGIRLRVVVEGRESGFVPCPNSSCRCRHIVSGRVIEVQVDQDGQWIPYDWNASGPWGAFL